MKKNYIISILFAFFACFTVNAQEQKEYNMVITLQNGTTITLGHNDIKNISFNDGEISISGNVVNTIDSLCNVTRDYEEMAYYLMDQVMYNEAFAHDLENRIESLTGEVLMQKDEFQAHLDVTDDRLNAYLDELITALEKKVNQEEFSQLKNELEAFIYELSARAADLEERIKILENK